jgi:hypothetical protein
MNVDPELEDTELETWREQWQSETTVPPGLRAKVERQSVYMKLGLAADVLVTLVMGGGTTAWALRSPAPGIVLVAAATWTFLAAAWIFVLAINRGNWSPSALDTVAFVDLSIRRCNTALKTVWFAVGLFFSEIAFSLTWAYHHISQPRQPVVAWLWFSSWRIDFVWLCTLVFLAAIAWYHAKKRAELARLLELSK